MLYKITMLLVLVHSLIGCTHIKDLIACQQPIKSPELLNEHVGWDHRSVDEVRCSNEQLEAVRLARTEKNNAGI